MRYKNWTVREVSLLRDAFLPKSVEETLSLAKAFRQSRLCYL